MENYKEKQKYQKEMVERIIRHLEKQKRNQSMNEDFIEGFDYAIFEIKKLYT